MDEKCEGVIVVVGQAGGMPDAAAVPHPANRNQLWWKRERERERERATYILAVVNPLAPAVAVARSVEGGVSKTASQDNEGQGRRRRRRRRLRAACVRTTCACVPQCMLV